MTRWSALAIALVLAACQPFDAAGSPPDAGPPVPPLPPDGAVLPDSGRLEAGTPDAIAPDPTCKRPFPPLVGNNTISSTNDVVPVGSVDAYGFTSGARPTPAFARCAWLYVADASQLSGSISLGLYANSNGKPAAQLAAATFTSVKPGWNSTRLENTAPIVGGALYWLAFTPSSGNFDAIVEATCGTGQLGRQTQDQVDAGQLPNPFTPNRSGPQCVASVYITE